MKFRPEALPLGLFAGSTLVGAANFLGGIWEDIRHNAVPRSHLNAPFVNDGHVMMSTKEWGSEEYGLLLAVGSTLLAVLYAKLVLKQKVLG